MTVGLTCAAKGNAAKMRNVASRVGIRIFLMNSSCIEYLWIDRLGAHQIWCPNRASRWPYNRARRHKDGFFSITRVTITITGLVWPAFFSDLLQKSEKPPFSQG